LFTTVNGLPVYFGPVTPRPDIVISPKLPPKGLPKTAIKKTGKLGLKWLAFRKAWLAANPPDWKGEYTCGICGRPVHISEVTLDHIIPRSRDPRRCFDPENIQPSHGECNLIKGSRIQLVDGRFH
jgi:5-methylcytosine-specific restriction endonuclease McrA